MFRYSFVLALIFGVALSVQSASASIVEKDKSMEKDLKSDVNKEPASHITLKPYVEEASQTEDASGYFSDYTYSHDSNFAPWAFTEEAVEIIDHYAPFIFRTKKSASIEELKVVLKINEFGKLTGFKILNEEADKGLKERMGHVLRKLPAAVPVPGFQSYEPMEFQLVMAY